jgi:hypothetical protein
MNSFEILLLIVAAIGTALFVAKIRSRNEIELNKVP